MTNAPSDLLAFRTTVRGKTGLTAVETGIVGDGAHQRTGGYHEGKGVLASIGRYHPNYGAGDTREDYSARLARDRAGLSEDASAMDISDSWPRGGRAAWLRFNNLLVADLVSGNPALAPIRALNYTPDGDARKRRDRQYGFAQIQDTTDSVTIHTHIEWYRDTAGQRGASFARLAQLIDAAITNTTPEESVPFFDDPNAKALGYRMDAIVSGSPTSRIPDGSQVGEPIWIVQTLNDIKAALTASATRETALAAAVGVLTTTINTLAAGGTSLDTAAVLTAVRAAADQALNAAQLAQVEAAAFAADQRAEDS